MNRVTLVCSIVLGLSMAACGPSPGDDGGVDAEVVVDGDTFDATTVDTGTAHVDASTSPADGGAPSQALGSPCTSAEQCADGVCFPAAFGTGVCSRECETAEGCPAGWGCGDFGGANVCRCEAGAEICNGEDDDCDGAVDEGRAEAIGCADAEACAAGACECPAAHTCGDDCVDTDTDPRHCGGCDTACEDGAVCTGGSCCTPSPESCNGADDDCDGRVDEGRGAAVGCADMELCAGGTCGCPAGADCGDACVDLDRDPANCGSCGTVCGDGLDCVSGVCCEASGTRVDMLLLVDTSNSMAEEQAALAREIPRLVEVLASGDLDGDGTLESEPVRDLHIGVITPDMGTGGYSVPTCPDSDFGADGILRTQGNLALPGCEETYPSFLAFRPADPGADPAAAAADLTCVAAAGTGGCGFEQQLEAVLKATTPSTSPIRFFRGTTGHADGANAGFLRDDSVLVTFLLTDENDCSASDPSLFDQYSAVYTANLNLRCVSYPSALQPLSRYVDGLLATRRDPRDLIFAAVTGVPEDLLSSGTSPDYARILADPRMDEVPDELMNGPRPSCGGPGEPISASPPRRFVRLAQELEEAGATSVLGSICQDDFGDPIGDVLGRIVGRLRESCAP